MRLAFVILLLALAATMPIAAEETAPVADVPAPLSSEAPPDVAIPSAQDETDNLTEPAASPDASSDVLMDLPPPAPPPPPPGRITSVGSGKELTTAESMSWRELRLIVERERAIWDRLKEYGHDDLEQQRASAEFRNILSAYQNLILSAPDFAEAFAAYGLLLSRLDQREDAVRAFLKANQINANMPMVKNQIGNYLFEDGRYKEALGYYLAAIELKEDEPLYHYQLGSLLSEYKRYFLADGVFDEPTLDSRMQHAFRRAAELAPDRWPLIYRYAESFYDLGKPDWPGALAAWESLESKAGPGVERQTIWLHKARVLALMDRKDDARAILPTVTEPVLEPSKQQIVEMLELPEIAPAPAPPSPAEASTENDAPPPQDTNAPDGAD